MLVYANALTLGARVPELLTIVATWLADLVGQPWNARRLLESSRHRFPLGDLLIHTCRLENRSLWALELEQPDRGVLGRRWQLEVAIRDAEGGGALATVIIRVHDDINLSSSFPAVAINQPALVRAFLEQGQPDAATPGLATRSLHTEADARQMAAHVMDKARTQTLVLAAQKDLANDPKRRLRREHGEIRQADQRRLELIASSSRPTRFPPAERPLWWVPLFWLVASASPGAQRDRSSVPTRARWSLAS